MRIKTIFVLFLVLAMLFALSLAAAQPDTSGGDGGIVTSGVVSVTPDQEQSADVQVGGLILAVVAFLGIILMAVYRRSVKLFIEQSAARLRRFSIPYRSRYHLICPH